MQNRLILLLLLTCAHCAKAQVPAAEDFFKKVRAEFDGENAKKTVAFVGQRWRLPGNKGFNESIAHVEKKLEDYGFVPESEAKPNNRLVYRLESRPMEKKAWEPVDASIYIVGEEEPLLQFKTNRNMLCVNSFPVNGLEAEVVDVGSGNPSEFDAADVKGKIVFGETYSVRLFMQGVQQRGALGIISYNLPAYLKPEKNTTSIQFGWVPFDAEKESFGFLLSYEARQRLKKALDMGAVKLRVDAKVNMTDAEELTVVATMRGCQSANEVYAFSAHVQEPGANDNASGVGCLLEMARVSSKLLKEGSIDPKRSIVYLWGDEITSTRRFVEEAKDNDLTIKWGTSLDMVGEDTKVTGGSFLIEKMPDPSAIWTRGDDKHSEWGGSPIKKAQLFPHYFNDFIINRSKEQGSYANWEVNNNPFEGGSDHVPFLKGKIPGLLFWHFTDQFYHTDNDRIDKVSANTLANVGTTALVSALTLTSANQQTAEAVLEETKKAATNRLHVELALSQKAIAAGSQIKDEKDIIETWSAYYLDAIGTISDMLPEGDKAAKKELGNKVEDAKKELEKETKVLLSKLPQ